MRDQSTTNTDPIWHEIGLADGLRLEDGGLYKSGNNGELRVGRIF